MVTLQNDHGTISIKKMSWGSHTTTIAIKLSLDDNDSYFKIAHMSNFFQVDDNDNFFDHLAPFFIILSFCDLSIITQFQRYYTVLSRSMYRQWRKSNFYSKCKRIQCFTTSPSLCLRMFVKK